MTTITHQTIPFKQPFTLNHNLVNVSGIAVIMLILAFILVKRVHAKPSQQSACRVIEKQFLTNKTVVYVLEYQQQRFLLADNQQALAIHSLPSQVIHEST